MQRAAVGALCAAAWPPPPALPTALLRRFSFSSSYAPRGSGSAAAERELLTGVHACAAALLVGRRRVTRVWAARTAASGDASAVGAVLGMAATRGLRVIRTDRLHLNSMLHGEAAQGLVVEVEALQPTPMEDRKSVV